jgi:hypothetical protein
VRIPRYNERVEDRRARHIGDIIRERNDFPVHDLALAADRKHGATSRALKILLLVHRGVLDLLATIGWFVTRPFITDDRHALTSRAQIRG